MPPRPQIKINIDRLDDNETVFLQRELQSVDPINYMTLFAGLLGRKYIPLVENVSPLDNEYLYKMFEIVGRAEVGSSGRRANDDNFVGVRMTPVTQSIRQIPITYGWPLREIQQAAAKNVPLDQITIMAAMSTVGRETDRMLAFGYKPSVTNMKGLLNNTLIEQTTPSTKTGTGTGTKWIRTVPVSPNEILADIAKIISDAKEALEQASLMPYGDSTPAFDSFTLLIDVPNYSYISSTPRSDHSDTSILAWAIANIPGLESIEPWNRCNRADTAGTGPRGVLYPRNPLCLGALIPQDFQSLSPQEEGHDIVVPGGGSCGGTVVRYPVACRYIEGI